MDVGREHIWGQVRPYSPELPPHLLLELGERLGLELDVPAETGEHLALHLVQLLALERVVRDEVPPGRAVRGVDEHLGGDDERGHKDAVARGHADGGEPRLDALEQEERGECH